MVPSLHRVKISLGNSVFIDLECVKGKSVGGYGFELPEEIILAEVSEEEEEGVPQLTFRDYDYLFERIQLREHGEYFIDITLPIPLDEAVEEYSRSQKGWPFHERISKILLLDPPRRWRSLSSGVCAISGMLRLGSHAGSLDLSLPYGNPLRVEVVCRKLDYFTEFQRLLEQVSEELTELVLQYDSPISTHLSVSHVTKDNESGLLFQMRSMMNEGGLYSAVDDIFDGFSSRLIHHQEYKETYEVVEPDPSMTADQIDHEALVPGGPLSRLFKGYTPSTLLQVEEYESVDTIENRYVKSFLEELLIVTSRLHDGLLKRGKEISAREVCNWQRDLELILDNEKWKEVGVLRQVPTNSQMMLKKRGYREIKKYEIYLSMGLDLPWGRGKEISEMTYGDLKPVSELYEYWCYFILRRAVSDVCQVELKGENSLVSVSQDGFSVSLRKGISSKVEYLYLHDHDHEVRVALYYNKKFTRRKGEGYDWDGSYTSQFDPDYSVQIASRCYGKSYTHWLHFDAKYRLDEKAVFNMVDSPDAGAESHGEKGSESSYEKEIKKVYRKDDLYKMHTYRDGIFSSRGAYIIYPGSDVELSFGGKYQSMYVRHPRARSSSPQYSVPSVGAISLKPDCRDSQFEMLRDFLRQVIEELTNPLARYQEEEGLY